MLPPAAKIAVRLHGVAPATMLRLRAAANRLLPADGTPRPLQPGHAVRFASGRGG